MHPLAIHARLLVPYLYGALLAMFFPDIEDRLKVSNNFSVTINFVGRPLLLIICSISYFSFLECWLISGSNMQ